MTVWCMGSINVDHVYEVPHIPAPGETLAATRLTIGLGGKGANQSVAAARAGAVVRHIGCVGPDGLWAREKLAGYGVDVAHVTVAEAPTGHAIINVDGDGENAITIFPGANAALSQEAIADALATAEAGDLLLLQNETSAQVEAAEIGRARGMRVVYSAAPFDPAAVRAVLPHIAMLVVNAGEAAALARTIGEVPCPMVVTKGPKGAEHRAGGRVEAVAAFPADPVDTTGAGDTFLGYLAAGLDAGLETAQAMRQGAAAAAIAVGRPGAADAVPSADEVAALVGSDRS